MRLLDLFCGAGGCARGYQLAGFEVMGVDLHPQPNYCGEGFLQADALWFLEAQGHEMGFDAIHASPPCQAYSAATPAHRREGHADLVGPTRDLLRKSGLPYVIENVVGAPLENPIQLCGSSFGLGVERHRLFETNFPVMAPPCAHGQQPAKYDIYEHGRWFKSSVVRVYGMGGGKGKEHWAEAMGIDWMTHKEMAQAIPPAFTEHLGGYLLAHLNRDRTGEPLPF